MISFSDLFASNGQALLVRCVAVLLLSGSYGYCFALAARLLGERGPEYDGRLTLNPFAHLDATGALVAVFFRFGWIKPIALEATRIRGGTWGIVAVVLASAGLLVALSLGLSFLRQPLFEMFPQAEVAIAIIGLIETTSDMARRFAFLSLLPVLPLAAGQLAATLLPPVAGFYAKYRWLHHIALALLIASGAAEALYSAL